MFQDHHAKHDHTSHIITIHTQYFFMHPGESGISEIISTVLAIILVIALAAIIGAIFLGWAVPLPKTPYIVTQATPVNLTNASAVELFLSQGETVSLAPSKSSGPPVKFSLTNGSITYNFVPVPGAAPDGWKPGNSLYLFRNATGSWVTDSTSSVKNNTGFLNGTWTVNIIDATSNILIAQHTIYLSGGGAPSPYPKYPGFTVEAWVKWNIAPQPATDDQKWATIVVDGNSDNNRRYQLQHDQINKFFEFAREKKSGGMTYIQSTTSPSIGTWYYVVGIYNQTPGTMSIFVNGVQEYGTNTGGTDTSGLRASSGPYQVGGPAGIQWPNSATMLRKFNGNIRGLNTYENAMGPIEVASRFAAGLP
jgi:hypothetical protein